MHDDEAEYSERIYSMVALASHASPLRTLLGYSEGENEGEAI